MKRVLYIFLIVSTVAVLNSCGDFLGNPPKGVTIPEACEDYEKMMNGTKSSGSGSLEFMTDNVHLLDKENSKATGYLYVSKDYEIRNMYSFAPGQLYLSGSSDYLWNRAYKSIFTYNIVANEVMDSKGSTEFNKKRIRAEALFCRAFEYFNLVNVYAKHYNAVSAKTDLGIPYITEGSINLLPHRHTVQEVYDNIFADLKEATSNLSEIVPNKTHPSKAAAYSLYARIYLTLGDFSNSLKYANMALNSNSNLLNLNDYIKQEKKTWDRVVLKSDLTKRLPDVNHPEAIYISFMNQSLQGSTLLSKSARDLFKKDVPSGVLDLRKEYYCSENVVDLGGTPIDIHGECAWVLYMNYNIGFTSVENMLIAAECEARIGSTERAMTLINSIRDKRLNSVAHLSAANKNEALTKVLEERRRELMMMSFRYFDLRRLNTESANAVTVTHKVDGETWTLAPNDPKYIFPISQEVLDFNPNMPVYDRK